MQVGNLKAEPNPCGGRIDLSWRNPSEIDFPGFVGVKILRREYTYPTIADIGTNKEIYDDRSAKAGEICRFSDSGLKAETVYYYAVFAYDGALKTSQVAKVSAMATGAYRSADDLYSKLPGLYQSYDTLLPSKLEHLDPADRDKGQLRRFLEMFGLQFDMLRSFASSIQNLYDVDRIDGALLRLLAQWIGWQSDFTLGLDKQRNQIKYAPHYYRTTGTIANLRAMINRLTTWDVQIKEFVHNILLSNNPEQLTIWEKENRGIGWRSANLVTLDLTYDGRPSAVKTEDGRYLLFYHARQSVPLSDGRQRALSSDATVTKSPSKDHWHIWYKIYDQDKWETARRLTFTNDINKYPAALQKNDGNIWLFWSIYRDAAGRQIPQICLNLISVGRTGRPARVQGKKTEPFAFVDGEQFIITLGDEEVSTTRVVTFHNEHFNRIGQATAEEVASLLNRELPGVEVAPTDEHRVTITSFKSGKAATIDIPSLAVANKLGLEGSFSGSDPVKAEIIGIKNDTFTLQDGDTLYIRIDGAPGKTVVFRTGDFQDINNVTAAEVISVINHALPGIAQLQADNGKVTLTSPTAGETSLVVVDVNASTAAPKLGFGAPLPPGPPEAADLEPTAFEDKMTGSIWLFWSSRRTGRWKIWYNCFNGNSKNWGAARPLTTVYEADREPAALFDANGRKIWVFWSRKKANGLWNIFYRTTTNLDLSSHPANPSESANGTWSEVTELEPILAGHHKKEPAPMLIDTNQLELFFSSNHIDGWNIWSNTLRPDPSPNDVQITYGQFTQRAPAVMKANSQGVRLWFRSNESQDYTSSLYPPARTMDSRYSGSTTVDTHNTKKIKLFRKFNDVQRYTYDTSKKGTDWYARDTIGIYFTPDTEDQKLIIYKQNLLENELKRFLPIQVRVVFIIQQAYNEPVYTYDYPEAKPQRLIGEQMIDTILGDVYRGLKEEYDDRVNFRWLRTWETGLGYGGLPDLSSTPLDLSFRLFLKGIAEGE